MSDAAKAIRDKLCFETVCTFDRGCGCLKAIDAALEAKDTEIERLKAALKPFAELADRKEYTLDDVPHGLMIDAKLALRGMRVIDGLVEQSTREQK